MSAVHSPKIGTPDPFLPGVREGFTKRFPNNDVIISDEPDFGIDATEIVLLDQLAKGAYGIVYKGLIGGKTYAIKVQEEVPALEEQVNILVELALLKSLKHTRLVASTGSSRIIEKRSPFEVKIMIAMELCDNGALRECLARNLSWDLRIRIARDVIEGISYLHEYKIVHRDIKTTNILITGDWRAKVCDFSFACHVDNLSKHDYVYGTDEFMAPEIALGEDFGTAADIFSYGIVLAEMISGQEPSAAFLRRTARDLFALDEEELRASVLPECPESLEALTLMCCEKEGEFRITAPEVVDWLQSLLEDRGVKDETISLPEKEVNDFSNVVSPIREGTVVYPKTDDANLMKFKSAAQNVVGAVSYMRRASGRSKSMNATPNRDGAVDPLDAMTPIEKERLQFGDISAPVSHSGYINYCGKASVRDTYDASSDSKSLQISEAPAPSLSSMMSRVAYLELQIQELKAENKSLTRNVSALVMISEDMKRAGRENFGEVDKKRTPRIGSTHTTPTSRNGAAKYSLTHRKSRSEDTTLKSVFTSANILLDSSERNVDTSTDRGITVAIPEQGFLHKTQNPPPPPPTIKDEIVEDVTLDISREIAAGDSEANTFAELRDRLQHFVGSGQFAKSVSSIYIDPASEKSDDSPDQLATSASFDTKKGPAGAMKLFGIGSFEKKLRKVGNHLPPSPVTSPTEPNVSPYDRSRLKSVPPPPPKSDTSSKSSPIPPPPPARSSTSQTALFSEAQLAVITAMISEAVDNEKVASEKKQKSELNSRFSEEKKNIFDYIDSKFFELQRSLNMAQSNFNAKDMTSSMCRSMSVSFGGLYHEMYDDKDPQQNDVGIADDTRIEHTVRDLVQVATDDVFDQKIIENSKSDQSLSAPQLKQLTKLENQMEVILAALAKIAVPSASEANNILEIEPHNSSAAKQPKEQQQKTGEVDVEDTDERNDYSEDFRDRHVERHYSTDPRFVRITPHPVQTQFGGGSPTAATVRKSTSSGSYDNNKYDQIHSRGSPELHRSPITRDFDIRPGDAQSDLTNAFRSFINVINSADEPASIYQSRSEYEAGIRSGYYDLSGQAVISPPVNSERTSNEIMVKRRGPDHRTTQAVHAATPSSRRGMGTTTPLSASSTWRDVRTPSTADSRKKNSPASELQQNGRNRSSSRGGSAGGPGGKKYNQIGTSGTPQMLEVDSSIAANFFRMHNTGTSLGREEAVMQGKSPKGSGWMVGDQEVRARGPGSGSRGGSTVHSPLSLRQLLQKDGSNL